MRIDSGVKVVPGVVGMLRGRKRKITVETPDTDVHGAKGTRVLAHVREQRNRGRVVTVRPNGDRQEVAEKDAGAHRALLRVKSREAGGQGHANADVVFQLDDGGGTIHTRAQITGKAASMGEGVVAGVLEALINDFTQKLGDL